MLSFCILPPTEPRIDQWNGPPADDSGGRWGGEERDDYAPHSSNYRGRGKEQEMSVHYCILDSTQILESRE